MRRMLFLILAVGSLHGDVKRIKAHLLLKDYQTAYQEAKAAYDSDRSPAYLESLIVTFLKLGQESRALALFEKYLNEASLENTDFLEEVAFGLIESGMNSGNPQVRAISVMAAFHANDARGVAILKKGLSDRSAAVRSITIKLVAKMRDKTLQKEILEIIAKERLYDLRLDAIRATGTMKIQEAKEALIGIITRSGDEARAAALEAYVNLDNTLRTEDLHQMAVSERAGFRALSDVVIAHLELDQELEIPLKHLSDSHQDIRAGALITLGRMVSSLRFPREQVLEKLGLLKFDERTKIAALWLTTLLDGNADAFLECLKSPHAALRIKAAAALAATGFHGRELIQKAYHACNCPYAKLNLAIGMIPLGIDEEEALATLKEALKSDERWAILEDPLGEAVVPSKLSSMKDALLTPESINQMVRLRLLNILAVKNDPDIVDMLRAFLKERRWGITGLASAMLLTEGDEEAKRSVATLLNDPDKKVRVQAAFVLAMWKSGDKAIDVLIEAYEGVDRELKMKVLEALGQIGSKRAIPFLASKLHEPYPTIRLAASLAIIQTIYH